ncbi:MAG: hypothetical protein IRZ21_12755 [Thermoleophilaceae bacterium]|nr:hypothetical protein [Thermoleophilaceae bacterium]
MVTIIGVLLVGGMLAVGAFAAASGDIGTSRKDQDRKQALAAAEAGIAFYLFHLNQDADYWTRCDNVPPPDPSQPGVKAPVNLPGANPMVYRNLPGSQAQYAIELLRSGPGTSCASSPSAYLIDPVSGTFKIRSTGRVHGIKRSMIATFKRRGFLDFLYFTDYETQDPAVYQDDDDRAYAAKYCLVYRWTFTSSNPKYTRPSRCREIQFASNDAINGPLHSNDMLLTCGTPTFGRPGKADSVETSAPKASGGYTKVGGCSGSPDFQGVWTTDAPYLKPPPTNGTLQNAAGANGLLLTGPIELRLAGDRIQYRKVLSNSSFTDVAWPANGVIYVKSTSPSDTPPGPGCNSNGYVYQQDYTTTQVNNGCGDVWVSGTYSKDLTIAAANDVIVQGSITKSSSTPDATLGLIANNFIRVYHPVKNRGWNGSCDENASGKMGGYLRNPQIDAAILALNHSFIVDNWYCGDGRNLGELHVNGAIAQEFRGPVGTSAGTGYIKDYNYRDSLKFHDPPSFLDPVQSSWRIARETEQVPAGG